MEQNKLLFHILITCCLLLQPIKSSFKFLIVGFEPFGGREINISEQVVKDLSFRSKKITLPVDFEKSWKTVEKVAYSSNFQYIVLIGEHSSPEVHIEQRAVNLRRLGNSFITIENGPEQIYSALSFNLREDLLDNNPGKYVCNFIYYKLLNRGLTTIFIHVPSYSTEEYKIKSKKLLEVILSILITIENTNRSD